MGDGAPESPLRGQRLHELVPGSRYKVSDGAPHNVYYEAAKEYNATVDAFLKTVV